MSPTEVDQLERPVTTDLRTDFDDGEVDLWLDPDSCEGALIVEVQDHVDVDSWSTGADPPA